ncbi:fumarylacetoacetase [Jatrophihabitans sp. YIM 134969]
MTRLDLPDDSGFGAAHLPYGVFSPAEGAPRVGVRYGDHVVDLASALQDATFAAPSLNPFLALGPGRWREVREQVGELVTGDVPDAAVHALEDVTLHLPIEVADYVDFYASLHHATNVGRIFRPDGEPLAPNWKRLPVGYHGRAGTVVVSGTEVVRPRGLRVGPDGPTFGPSERLDFEAELGFVVGAGSSRGTPVPTDAFAEHVFGVVLLDDWSARDVQAFETVPLGPFLGKSFATSIAAWVTPLAALEAARLPLPPQDPTPAPYLRPAAPWALDLDFEVAWNGEVVSRPRFRDLWWSADQMLAHTTVNGASLRTGDLYGSGTVSGPEPDQRGCLLELTWGGTTPLRVGGADRTFLVDGDDLTIRASAPGTDGRRLTLGEVAGRVTPALVD